MYTLHQRQAKVRGLPIDFRYEKAVGTHYGAVTRVDDQAVFESKSSIQRSCEPELYFLREDDYWQACRSVWKRAVDGVPPQSGSILSGHLASNDRIGISP